MHPAQSPRVPPNILLAPKTRGLMSLFNARNARAYLVLWRKGGNIRVRILSKDEIQRFLSHYEDYGWKHHTRIYQIDANIIWTIVRGKLRKPIQTSLF